MGAVRRRAVCCAEWHENMQHLDDWTPSSGETQGPRRVACASRNAIRETPSGDRDLTLRAVVPPPSAVSRVTQQHTGINKQKARARCAQRTHPTAARPAPAGTAARRPAPALRSERIFLKRQGSSRKVGLSGQQHPAQHPAHDARRSRGATQHPAHVSMVARRKCVRLSPPCDHASSRWSPAVHIANRSVI